MAENPTIERIIRLTSDIFLKNGFKRVTMDDIASELSISKKTLYKYFEDKSTLVMECVKYIFEKDITEIQRIQDHAVDSIEEAITLSQYVRIMLSSIQPSILYDLKKYYKDSWELFLTILNDQARESIKKSLKRGIKEGYFRKTINPDILATLRIEEALLAFDLSKFPRDQVTITEIHNQITANFVYGLVTKKGFEKLETYRTQMKL